MLDVPTPKPGPGQVLTRVAAVTTCRQWDLHLQHNEPMFVGHAFRYPYPLGQPGDEATGMLAAIGPGVPGFPEGDHVSAQRDPGHDVPAAYVQYVVLDAGNVIHVPAALSPRATASVELAVEGRTRLVR